MVGVMRKTSPQEFPGFVTDVLDDLINEDDIQEIWFIGSRANGCERSDSDWDFIVFTSNLVREHDARHSYVDVIRVDSNGKYLLEGQKMDLCGSFSTWKWRDDEPGFAFYTVRKTPDIEPGQGFNTEDVRYIDLMGIRVWRRNA
jgi:predicted nucleotidyltransferase